MVKRILPALALALPLGACGAADISGIYYDRAASSGAAAGEIVGARAVFIGGYSMSPELNPGSARRLVHERIAALPDGATLTFGANGCLIGLDDKAREIITAKRLVIVDTPESGCGGAGGPLIFPKTPARANPGAL